MKIYTKIFKSIAGSLNLERNSKHIKLRKSTKAKRNYIKLKKVQRKKLVVKTKKLTHTTLSDGFRDSNKLLALWTHQQNPPKVYVLGKRVHHGPIFGILALVGLYYDKPYFTGYGIAGVLDDFHDADEWFNLESGGDLDKIIDYV